MIVLHIARADLQNIHVADHHLNLRSVHDFAHAKEAEFFGGLTHKFQALFAHALKRVGRCAGLKCPGA